MTILTDRPAVPDAETAARARVADILSTLAADRAARHEGVMAVSSGHPVLADPPPAALSPVNSHPGSDFYPEAA